MERHLSAEHHDTDPERFEQMLSPHLDMLRGYVHRLIGHPADAEDLLQDIQLKALERLGDLRDQGAFKGWLFSVASSTCLDFLRRQKRWRPLSQPLYERACASSDALRADVVAATRDASFAYDVHEHIAFCFTCVGRSLPPEQAVALTLREVVGLSNQEAATAAGVTESVLRHRLADARGHMRTTFEDMCSLVNKDGVCRQCAGFREATADNRRGRSLPVLHDRPDPLQARMDIARQTTFVDGVSSGLHNVMFRALKQLENAATTTPSSET